MGSLYLRGRIWWIKYSKNGRPICESSRTDKKMVATVLLKQREGEIAQGRNPGIYFDRVSLGELLEELQHDYELAERKSLWRLKISLGHIRSHFGDRARVVDLTTDTIRKYTLARQGQGASNATVNRELAALRRALTLGSRSTPPKVDRVPYVQMLREDNARQGFLEPGDFSRLVELLPEYLRGLVTFAYRSGWRKSEITGLTWDRVDLTAGTARLNPGMTKNNEGRVLYLDDELKAALHGASRARKGSGHLVPWVFPNESRTAQIRDFRHAWDTACEKAGMPGLLFHDMRRSAVRNLVRGGVSETVAMKVSGHKTATVFRRYNIVSEDDLRDAAAMQQQYLETRSATKSGTIVDFGRKTGTPRHR
jgi:integrase